MKRSDLIALTEIDIVRIKSLAHFTPTQEDIFNELCKDQTDVAILQKLYLSGRKYYANKKIVLQKVDCVISGTKTKR